MFDIEEKVNQTLLRIEDWYESWEGQVYVAFSGGKDSSVLLDLVRSIYPDVPGVFSNTGLEYPEIKQFVKTKENIIWVRPKITFQQVIEKYGYPVISKEVSRAIYYLRNYNVSEKRKPFLENKLSKKSAKLLHAPFKVGDQCCDYLKKAPFTLFEKESKNIPIIGMKTSESRLRKSMIKQCNNYDRKHPISHPLYDWTDEQIQEYIDKYDLELSKIYAMGHIRTGCMFCMFGIHLQNPPNKFQMMAIQHPKYYDYCINKLGLGEVLDYIGVNYKPMRKGLLY